ncbi:putative metal dependent phosphohydrolase [Dehalococcoides sp. UCH007]|nr:putative metal dependent phosphohydrolase [Dehalococcoides sp. UCH007]
MVLGQNLFDQSGRLIYSNGMKLSEEYIQVLQSYGMKEILVHNSNMLDIPVQCLYSPLIEATLSIELRELFTEMRGGAEISEKMLEKVFDPIYQMAGELFPELIGEPNLNLKLKAEEYQFVYLVKVAGICMLLGKRAGYGIYDLPVLRTAALPMNLGYINLSGNEINMIDPFCEPQSVNIKNHPLETWKILLNYKYIHPDTLNAVKHHERYDGNGYPDKLSGVLTPLSSQILAVADSYDAMTSLRPYRQPLSQEAAVKELLACRGSQFNPKVVDAFVEVLNNVNKPSAKPIYL